ncbi:hypothetical protein TcCL_ESM00396 [Trypanosoma cruzi]|nr:hypothetical protein TcCL_ESM00396 [Trypanosoma cruzi]
MPDFTRDDEHSLDLLRNKNELGKIKAEESKLLQQLEQKYDMFIREGLSNMSRMAPRRTTRQLRLRCILISWPMLLLSLGLFFIFTLFLLQFYEGGGGWSFSLLQWHICLVGVLLVLVALVCFTQIRERLFINRAILCACVLISVILGLLTLAVLFHGRDEEYNRWDRGLFVIFGVGEGLIVVESASLLFNSF